MLGKFLLKKSKKSIEVRGFIAPAPFYGVLLLNVKRLVKFLYCLNPEVENILIHPKKLSEGH